MKRISLTPFLVGREKGEDGKQKREGNEGNLFFLPHVWYKIWVMKGNKS